MPRGIPLPRGQGNQRFVTTDLRRGAKRGQTVPYDLNGAPAGGTVSWGDIIGSLSAQADLVAALAAKLDDSQASAYGLTVLAAANAAALKALLSLAKGDVGLGNVDDTADAAKNVLTATRLFTPRALSMSGDMTWTVSFDGSAAVAAAGTLASVNSNVGSFGGAGKTIAATVNAKGLVTAFAETAIAITASQVSDFSEAADDRVAALVQNGTGITWSYNDAAGTLTPTVTITQYTDEMAQDAVGAMVDSTLVYVDATPLLSRAALTGDVTAAQGSNVTTIPNDTVTYAKMQNVSASSRIIGRITAGAGDPEELTAANVKTILALAQADISGLTTADSPQFTAINLGHASDTTMARSGAGDVTIEGNVIYRAGGTDVPVTDGGTGRSTSTTAYGLIAAGTTATGAHQTLPTGATTEILVGGGAAALPVWTTATGTGAPARAGSPTFTGTANFANASATGTITAAGKLLAWDGGSTGRASLEVGDATHQGYLSLRNESGVEQGYVGWESAAGKMEINSLLGWEVTGQMVFNSAPRMPSYTVAGLPSAATAGAGAIAYVTDSNTTTFNATVAGGGANKIKVTSDGANWKVG